MFGPVSDISLGQLILVKQFLGELQVVDEEQVPGPEGHGGQPVSGNAGVGAPVYQPSPQGEEGKRTEEREGWRSRGEFQSGEIPSPCGQH